MKRPPIDRDILNCIYEMYLPAYEERVKDDSMSDQKIYLPIDIRAVAQRLECSEHLLFRSEERRVGKECW